MRTWDDEPGAIREYEAAVAADRRAEGLVLCAGPYCQEWLRPEQVVTRDQKDCYGPCCALTGCVPDADLVEAVCRTIVTRTANGDGLGVVGRRVSVLRHLDGCWAVVYKDGRVLFTAHDVFEVARWYCGAESGQMEYDPEAPLYALPSDAEIAQRYLEERADDITRRH
jgi:hypothetical protein